MSLYRHLEERLLLLEQSHNNCDNIALEERCLALQQQVEEMEVKLIMYLHEQLILDDHW